MFALLKTKLWKYLAGAFGFLAVLLGAYLKGRGDKAKALQAKTAEEVIEITKKVRKNAEKSRNPSDGSAVERLRKNYSRD